MESPAPALGLERELTCSICTELLYQPLTLLDCLHTFCGACLKDWFTFQASSHAAAPSPPPAGTPVYTCPSCRAGVRGSRHNATVATLLDMYLKANPARDRSDAEKMEIAAKYKRGEDILPAVAEPKGPEELMAEEDDRRLLEEVRALSLREAGVEAGREPRRSAETRRHPPGSRSGDGSRRRSESRRRAEAEERTWQIERQSSIRSLISSADMSERDIEREIEEFARQIQEEGILDGLDLDNIDLARDDELSRKITEAYRRRQRQQQQRSRQDSGDARSSSAVPAARQDSRPASRRRNSAGASVGERSRSQSAATRSGPFLEVQPDRRRRRTASSGRSSTTPVRRSPVVTPAARSQTDLGLQTRAPEAGARENWTIGSPTMGPTSPPESSNLSFASRVPRQLHPRGTSQDTSPSRPARHRPSDLLPSPQTSSPLPSPSHKPAVLFTEPSITCTRCSRPHIEYEVHYTCDPCSEASPYTLCLTCYRAGHGCAYWFGFGYEAFEKWDRARQRHPALAPPHKLWAGRYVPPLTLPIKDDGGAVRTAEDPRDRLQSGAFCDGCLSWAGDVFWRCSHCNGGEWGFCSACVNTGKCCTHPLLPLSSQTRGAGAGVGVFRPCTFTMRCDLCREAIPPQESRHHCFECTSSAESDTLPGSYDICAGCYGALASRRQVSPENGVAGWRRCPQGHRMVMVTFKEGRDGLYRYISRDLVGGQTLRVLPVEGDPSVQRWCWKERGTRMGRLVGVDVTAATPVVEGEEDDVVMTGRFPEDGGGGMVVEARWAWLPAEGSDELYFPRGAEVREVEKVNDEFYVGQYMGRDGLFPAAYVVVVS